jgi:uncharacterized protein
MSASHGLSDETISRVVAVLSRYSELDRAILFGSRAKGTYKRGSDIDLALSGAGLDWRVIGRIYDALDDLLLPYHFSLIKYDSDTDADLAAHIDRVGIPVYDRTRSQPIRS